GLGVQSKEAARRLATISRRVPAGRQSGWAEEVRRSGTTVARRLSGNGRTERADGMDGSPELVSPGPRPRMGRPILSGVGQAGESRRVEGSHSDSEIHTVKQQ